MLDDEVTLARRDGVQLEVPIASVNCGAGARGARETRGVIATSGGGLSGVCQGIADVLELNELKRR